jgi:predicted transcriptional regulator
MATTLSRKEAEQRRLRGIALLDQGCSQSEVARLLGVTPAAVSQWAKARRQGGD